MRERSARVESRARSQRAHRGRGRGGARTMPRWLWAAVLLAAAGTGAAAWTPPEDPILLTPRSRRHVLSTTRHLQLLGWHLELQENRAIRSPYYDECLFYKGRVIGEENSTATVTECAGQLYGLLQVGKEDFVLQPTQADGAHVLRRRDVLLSERPSAYNLTGDTVTDLELDLEEDAMLTPTPLMRSRHAENIETDYFRAEPISRPISGVNGLWLEMAIVADHTMLKFHGRERVNHYILALMNIVSAIFNDPSLDSNMTLVINNLYILNEDKDSIVKFGNVKKSLEAVNKWNYKHLIKLPAGNNGWDATVWLTRAPLGGPSGFAPVGGVCSRQRSAAINRDEGLTSAFVIAHELAHLLGLTHDGENSCQTEGARGSVMAPTVLATLHNYAWSSCSKKQFHEKSKLWWCLHERSREDGVELGGAKALSNYVFTLDEQCRTEFGEGFSVCANPLMVRSAVCSRLWCANSSDPDVCRSKRAPPLEGTPCGKNKWCVDRVCEPMPGPGTSSRVDVDSSDDKRARWGEWGEWSECTANCGYGLRSRMRRCRHRGSISPSACEGASSQDAVCWAGRACAATRDARALLCNRQRRTLIPHVPTDESKQCEIWCMDYTGGVPSNFGSLPDGTPCNYDKPYDVCSQGTCVKGQCNSTDPACNWCPDGYCVNNTRIYQKQLAKEWTQVMIPFGSHQLSIHITTPIPLHIALRELKRGKPVIELSKHSRQIEIHDQQGNYLKYDPNVPQNLQIIEVDSNVIDIKEGRYRWEGEVVAAGTVLRWRQTDTDVIISSAAPLQTDLIIMVIPESALPAEELVTVQVAVNYSMAVATERARPLENRRTRIRWPCSASCGGGVRVVRPRCSSRDARKCPPARYQPCNTHSCEFTWASGEWEECSATCGGAGIRERQIYCVPANVSTSTRAQLIRYSVSPALCPALKPDRQQDCNRLPCPVYWREAPWTPCSITYGRCMARRPVECPASDESLCGPKPRERRRFCRRRRCSGGLLPSRLTIVCPPADTTQYCEFFNVEELRRNCQVQPFRKYCCIACRDIDRFRHSNRFS